MVQRRDDPVQGSRSVNREQPILTVSEVTGAIKNTLETDYGRVRVRGEISNLRQPSSGHFYFALKDDRSQLRSVMFRGSAVGLRFLPADGLEVEAEGEISVYEPRGDLQLLVRQMQTSGLGALMQAFEALKQRLAGEGLFNVSRKRPLPTFPRVVGIITSPTGAAVRDLVHVLSRRWPAAGIVFHPTQVQGEGAAWQIARALDRMSRWGGADVVIVGRGGGSLEDLWAFNEESVARAIVACGTPVVSAVGHEIDVTIADLVADANAATPSAAAEIVVPDKREVTARLASLYTEMQRMMVDAIETRRRQLNRLAGAYGFRKPESFLRREVQRLDDLSGRLQSVASRVIGSGRERCQDAARRLALHHPRGRLLAARTLVQGFEGRLGQGMGAGIRARRNRVGGIDRALKALNPAGVLARGYCLVRDPRTHRVLNSASGLSPGSALLVQFLRERVHTRVELVEDGRPRELEGVWNGGHDGEEKDTAG
jgi:exodeoxyribonuclease VII large subunit